MNGHVLIVIGILAFEATGSLAFSLDWRIIFYSEEQLPVDKDSEIYFQVSGSKGVTAKRFSKEIIDHTGEKLVFDAGWFDLAQIGNVTQLIISRRILGFSFKEWQVTKIELVSSPWNDPRAKYTFFCNCSFTLLTGYNLESGKTLKSHNFVIV